MSLIHYFAYGSNLHPLRLIERVPSARLLGVASYPARRLGFDKIGRDGSGKCTLLDSTTSGDQVYGAIYQIEAAQQAALDEAERRGRGYRVEKVALNCQGRVYSCFTYVAQASYMAENLRPYEWYKQLVVLGGQYLGFPAAYISAIAAEPAVEDPNHQRQVQMAKLIKRIEQYPRQLI